MKIESISETWLGKITSRLPPDHTWVKLSKAGIKAAILGRRIIRGQRVVFGGLEDAVLEGFYEPGPAPDQALIDTLFTAISPGTEKAYYLNHPNFQHVFPFSPGYSGCGTVRATGPGMSGFKHGDLVAGVFKHRSVNIAGGDEIVSVPGSVAAAEAAFATIGVIALIGVRAAEIAKGETVAVMGQGIIGQIANQIARASVAGRVVAVARTEAKERLSIEHGADSFIALGGGGNGPADLADKVIDASGSSVAFETALRLTRPGGTTVLLGSSADYGIESSWPRIVFDKRITVKGAHIRNLDAEGTSYRERVGEFLDLVAQKKVRLTSLITHRFQPEEAAKVYRHLADGERGLVGAIFDWRKV
jgi:2-desacetyl-2-hydroxyethyl bacteriochlorophyllide A dehydrogenase